MVCAAVVQVLGAAKMVIEGGGKHPGAFKDSVASPAGAPLSVVSGTSAPMRSGC